MSNSDMNRRYEGGRWRDSDIAKICSSYDEKEPTRGVIVSTVIGLVTEVLPRVGSTAQLNPTKYFCSPLKARTYGVANMFSTLSEHVSEGNKDLTRANAECVC